MSIEVNATEQIIEVNATGSTIDINVTSQTVDVNATTSVIDVNVTNGPGPGVPDGGLTGQVLKKQSNTDYDTYWAADTAGVPYIGATGNVDLGEYELKAGQLTLDTSPTGTASVGTTRWNDTIGSSETTLKGGSVILKNGVDLVARVVNKVTPNTTLTKAAYQAVRISGAQGQRLAVAFAQANNDNNSADTIGLVTETIATNQEGFIMTVGNLEDINTTGSLQGETWADGDVLYLSPTVAGAITNIKPVAPQHLVVIGYVEYAHANHGKIYVKVMNGWELGELHDVDTTGATNGQVLKYNGTIWTPSSDLDTGITSLNGLTALTQTFATGTSGTDFNISSATSTHTFNLPTASATNRGLVSSSDWSTFNAKIGGTLATGQVAYGSATNTIAGSATFTFSPTAQLLLNNSVTAATAIARGANFTPTLVAAANNDVLVGLDIAPTFTNGAFTGIRNINTRFQNTGFINVTSNSVTVDNGSGQWNTRLYNYNLQTYAQTLTITAGSSGDGFSSSIFFRTTSSGTTATGMALFSSNNLLLQNGGTFTDGGQRLQVQGDAFIKGSGNTSGSTALTVQNSDGTNMWRFRNDGSIRMAELSTAAIIFPFTNTYNLPDVANGRNIQFFSQITSQSAINGTFYFAGLNYAQTSNAQIFTNITNGFAPTSGTATFALLNVGGTINQTGGANGITRGLYVNPTLTAAADWRSIEWSNNTGWGLYGAGTSDNYLGGRLSIGTTSQSQGLRIGRNPTAADSRSIFVNPAIQNTVTSKYVGVSTSIGLNTSGFTLPDLVHFEALNDGTHTAGVVTNLYGFRENMSSYNATNVFGFYGNIPSGTNRWNLYCNGTANNYMAGSLGVGATNLPAHSLRIARNITGATTSYGATIESTIQSDVTSNANLYFTSPATQAAAFTLVSLRHYYAIGVSIGASSSVTNQYGFVVDNSLTTATNNFGFYGDIANATGRWNLYCNGTAPNFMAGSLGIGTTSLGNYSLRITRNTTGATSAVSVGVESTISSDVTNVAYGYLTSLATQASSFTLSEIRHFNALQGTFGAGSTVTVQSGFLVGSNMVGATNNYGFRGLIPSGTGRWNIYMDGTAANYLNGNTIIGGTATDGGQKLQVNGDTIIKGSGLTSASTGLIVQNSAGTNMFQVRNDNSILFAQSGLRLYYSGSGNITGNLTTGNNSQVLQIVSGVIGNLIADNTSVFEINQNITSSATITNVSNTIISGNFSPASGSVNFNGLRIGNTINQTGGANGITRGLYINPTLTAAADWRAIEVSAGVSVMAPSSTASASIRIPSGTAPTSPQNGDIWFDGTDLKMRIGGVTKTFTLV